MAQMWDASNHSIETSTTRAQPTLLPSQQSLESDSLMDRAVYHSPSPEGTSLSDKFDKMDTSETSVSSEKTSPLMDGPSPQATVKQQSDINTSLTEDNLTSNLKTTEDFQKQTTDTNNFNHMTTKPGSSRTDSTTSMSSFHDETELPTNYMTETVDFPSSPHQMKLMQRSTNGLQDPSGEETVHEDDESSWMDQEDDLFRNVLSPESDEAKLKKEITRGNNGNDTCYLETSNRTSTGDESMRLEDQRFKLADYPSSISNTSKEHVSPDSSSVAQANFSFNPKISTSTPFKYEEFKPELVPLPSVSEKTLNSTRLDISQLIIDKIDHCYNSNLRIKDMALLCENLKSELTRGEIKQVLECTSFFSDYLDDYVLEALQMIALESPQPVTSTTVKKTKIKLDLESLDDSIVNHFEGELRMEAIFERNPSFRVPKSTSRSISSSIYKNKTDGHSTIRSTILQPNVSEPSGAVRKTLITAPPALSVINSSEDSTVSTSSPQTETPDSQPKAKLEFSYEDFTSTAIPTCDFNPNPTHKEWKSLTYFSDSTSESSPDRPNSLNTTGKKKRKIKVNPDILNTTDDADDKSLSSLSNRSDGDILSPSLDDLITPDDITTPDILEDSLYSPPELIPEVSAAEERDDERRWRTCVVSGVQQKIDMKVIEPYKKILSHGGYYGPKRSAIVVFCACFLPDHGRKDYDYVIDNLFLYILTTLDQLVAEDYLLVYLHGALERNNMPSFGWLKRCYNLIDRRLRKNLKGLYLVHPTFWLKTIVLMTKPFVSSKFARKLQFVSSLQDLFDLIPVDHMSIPDKVKQMDFQLMIKEKKKHNKKQVHSCEPKQGGTKNDWTKRSLKEVDTDAPYRKAHSESQEFTEGWL